MVRTGDPEDIDRLYLLKDRTQADIKDLFTQALSQRDLAELFRNEIIPRSEETLNVSLEAYRVGQTDFLQLVDNWRQLLKFRVMLSQQESQLRQTLSILERVVGGTRLRFPGEAVADARHRLPVSTHCDPTQPRLPSRSHNLTRCITEAVIASEVHR